MTKSNRSKTPKYKIPSVATKAFHQFLHEEATLLSFSSDYRRESAEIWGDAASEARALRERLLRGDFSSSPSPKSMRDSIRPGMMAEMTFARRVDNYLLYLQDTLASIFQLDPSRAGKLQIEAAEFAGAGTINDVLKILRSEALESITKRKRDELFKAFVGLGFEQLKLQRSRAELSEALEIRDIIVHRRGTLGASKSEDISTRFAARLVWPCGNLVREYEQKHGPIEPFMWNSVTAIDAEAIRLFQLPTVDIPHDIAKL